MTSVAIIMGELVNPNENKGGGEILGTGEILGVWSGGKTVLKVSHGNVSKQMLLP